MKAARTCSVDGCERPHVAKGFCDPHVQRWRRSGDPGPTEISVHRPLAATETQRVARKRECEIAWRKVNSERINANSNKNRMRPEVKERESEWSKQRRAAMDPALRRANDRRANLRRLFQLTPEEYGEMLQRQDGVCAICRQPETNAHNGQIRALAVDHCHADGHIRGLLCSRCNTMIGQGQDSVERLWAGIAYLTLRG